MWSGHDRINNSCFPSYQEEFKCSKQLSTIDRSFLDGEPLQHGASHVAWIEFHHGVRRGAPQEFCASLSTKQSRWQLLSFLAFFGQESKEQQEWNKKTSQFAELTKVSWSNISMTISGGFCTICFGSPWISICSKMRVWSQVGHSVLSSFSVTWLWPRKARRANGSETGARHVTITSLPKKIQALSKFFYLSDNPFPFSIFVPETSYKPDKPSLSPARRSLAWYR